MLQNEKTYIYSIYTFFHMFVDINERMYMSIHLWVCNTHVLLKKKKQYTFVHLG